MGVSHFSPFHLFTLSPFHLFTLSPLKVLIMKIIDLAEEDRPREKMARIGAENLTNSELFGHPYWVGFGERIGC